MHCTAPVGHCYAQTGKAKAYHVYAGLAFVSPEYNLTWSKPTTDISAVHRFMDVWINERNHYLTERAIPRTNKWAFCPAAKNSQVLKIQKPTFTLIAIYFSMFIDYSKS